MITLKNYLLEFDITGTLGYETNQHIDFYNIGVKKLIWLKLRNSDECLHKIIDSINFVLSANSKLVIIRSYSNI